MCQTLYGAPSESTGLSAAQCSPTCECQGGEFRPRPLPANTEEQLLAFELLNPPALLAEDPYAETSTPTPSTGVCAVKFEANSKQYRTIDYASAELAEAADATVSHNGACGMCSSLEDLAVYATKGDLTNPVRACGFKGLSEGEESNLACLADLGFTEACAQIWYFNTRNTRKNCLGACLEAVGKPYHFEDGSINSCLQCDEDKSGPVFKKFAGRTRRNSGLASAICRPCDTVARIDHDYIVR